MPLISRTILRMHLTALLLITALLTNPGVLLAQDGNTNADSNVNTNISTNANANRNTNSSGADNASDAAKKLPPCPSPDAYAQVAVSKVYKAGTGGETSVELDDEITVEVQNLNTLLERARCTTPTKKILLFLDGRPLKDITPFPPTDPRTSQVIFPLKRTENSREAWTHILGEPEWAARMIDVSVGVEDEYPVASTAKLALQVIPHGWFIFWLFIFAGLFVGFLLLAYKTDILRDSGPQPGGNARKPYSLSRAQAAWWFFLILASYLFIGMITGDFSTTITGTVLGLLGISAGTVVGSAFVDAGKASTPQLPPSSPPAGAAPPLPSTNEYWWVDILSDANGVNFHRFQIAAWTVVLGIIFIVQVYKGLAMPTFNGSLLALLGISAGTYLGLKIPEPK